MKKIYFTVTNDLYYDQRMQRICTSLAEDGYDVTLVGRELPASPRLIPQKFKQRRIRCWFNKGKLFYLEFNLRLCNFLMLRKMDAICAIDLDTISPCHTVSWFKRVPRIYDAHELFTEMKEVITRPLVKKLWTQLEKRLVPKFRLGYTVSSGIAEEFKKRYSVNYETIRNVPVLKGIETSATNERFILFAGTVNEARGLEYLIPAMKFVNCKLVICGDGNFMQQLKKLIAENKLEDKIELKGKLSPHELRIVSGQATVGIALAEKEGLNQWLALPNKFFDYIHAGLPQVTMNYPEYRKINKQFEVALLVDTLEPGLIAESINTLLANDELRNKMKDNCLKAREELNWQKEEKKLLAFYRNIFDKK